MEIHFVRPVKRVHAVISTLLSAIVSARVKVSLRPPAVLSRQQLPWDPDWCRCLPAAGCRSRLLFRSKTAEPTAAARERGNAARPTPARHVVHTLRQEDAERSSTFASACPKAAEADSSTHRPTKRPGFHAASLAIVRHP